MTFPFMEWQKELTEIFEHQVALILFKCTVNAMPTFSKHCEAYLIWTVYTKLFITVNVVLIFNCFWIIQLGTDEICSNKYIPLNIVLLGSVAFAFAFC